MKLFQGSRVLIVFSFLLFFYYYYYYYYWMIKKVICSIFINIISHERKKLRYRFVRIMQDPYRCEEKKRDIDLT